jgi:signal transduction histidine kinase
VKKAKKEVKMAINITSRIRNALVGLTLAICLLFTGIIFMLVYVIEDQIFVNQVRGEQAAFESVIALADSDRILAWQPSTTNMRRVDSIELLSASLPAQIRQEVEDARGIHEYFDDEVAMFIAHQKRSDTGASYYLEYDVVGMLAVRETKTALLLMIALVTLLTTGLALLLATRLAKATLSPVSRLSDALHSNDFDDVVIKLANEFSTDEVGVLARELAKALKRLRELSEREYEFNRGVSHELRSPIQVAQSSAELLQVYVSENDTNIDNIVARLNRSVVEMNEISEAFLWLASDRVLEAKERCRITDLRNTLETLQSVFPRHAIEIDNQVDESASYPIPATVLSVVIRNLVRNAMIHGEQSPIIVMEVDRILVSNSVSEHAAQDRSFGIGLSIVQRICERFGCTLNTSKSEKGKYVVVVEFAH